MKFGKTGGNAEDAENKEIAEKATRKLMKTVQLKIDDGSDVEEFRFRGETKKRQQWRAGDILFALLSGRDVEVRGVELRRVMPSR